MDFVLVTLLRVNTGGVSFDMLNDTQLLRVTNGQKIGSFAQVVSLKKPTISQGQQGAALPLQRSPFTAVTFRWRETPSEFS